MLGDWHGRSMPPPPHTHTHTKNSARLLVEAHRTSRPGLGRGTDHRRPRRDGARGDRGRRGRAGRRAARPEAARPLWAGRPAGGRPGRAAVAGPQASLTCVAARPRPAGASWCGGWARASRCGEGAGAGRARAVRARGADRGGRWWGGRLGVALLDGGGWKASQWGNEKVVQVWALRIGCSVSLST